MTSLDAPAMKESWIGFIPLRSISIIHNCLSLCGYTGSAMLASRNVSFT
jgi:hypothetical protein